MASRALADVVAVAFIAFFCCLVSAQESEVTDTCLGCICEAVSGCNTTFGCSGGVCGLFRITWAYWADSGKPVIQEDIPTNDGAYRRCVTDVDCAASVVRGYMEKFGQDCNGDGKVDCFDFAAIHRLGAYSCNRALDSLYENRFTQCKQQIETFGRQLD